MRKTRMAIAVAGADFAIVGISAPAMASQDIGWTWNSGDHDAEARFEATGEHYYAVEVNGNDYVDWSGSSGSGRWWIPGSETNTQKDLNLSFAENTAVTLQVCEEHTAFPDDCSSTKTGVA
jgi:hypothetical protein